MSESTQPYKGWWHSSTGVPFWTTITGGYGSHLKLKKDTAQLLQQSQQNYRRQLQINADTQQQLEETALVMEQYISYSHSLDDEQAQNMQRQLALELQMQKRKDNLTTRSLSNTIDSLIGLIPYIGKVYSYGNLAKDAYQHRNDMLEMQGLNEKIQSVDIERQHTSTVIDTALLKTDQLLNKEAANFNALKNIKMTQDQLQQSLDKM